MKLLSLIEQYIAFQQSLGTGSKLDATSYGLSAVPSVPRPHHRRSSSAGGSLPGRDQTGDHHVAHQVSPLAILFPYAVSRGYLAVAPLPTAIPKRPPPFVPYIFSHDELRRLFQVADDAVSPVWNR